MTALTSTHAGISVSEHYAVHNTRHGLMLLNVHDCGVAKELASSGEWAWNEIEHTVQYAKGVVLDIGANIGTHTLVYAQTAQVVYAFEPQPFVYDNLCANLLLNNVINVKTVQCALGATTGNTTILIEEPTEYNAPAVQRVGQGTNQIAMYALDDLALPPVNFIKIDVEGYELEVLKGAVAILKRDQPVVFCEIHFPHLIGPIFELMGELGYTVDPNIVVAKVVYPDGYILTEGDVTSIDGYLFKPGVTHD